MEDLIQNIITTTVNKLSEAAVLKYQDENWGQLQFFGEQCPVQWPCALVDVSSAQFSNIGKQRGKVPEERQQGILTLEITVGNIKLTNTSGRAPKSQVRVGLSIWEIVNEVNKVLQGWNPNRQTGGFIRTAIQSITRDDGIQEKKIVYTIGLHDC